MIPSTAPAAPLHNPSMRRRNDEDDEDAEQGLPEDAFEVGPPASEPDDSPTDRPAADDVDTATAPLE